MVHGQKARLPRDPNDPWNEFERRFNAFPSKPLNRIHEALGVLVYSEHLKANIYVVHYIIETMHVIQLMFPNSTYDLVDPEVRASLEKTYKWTRGVHIHGTDRIFRTFSKDPTESSIGAKLTPTLHFLGVSPYQNWRF